MKIIFEFDYSISDTKNCVEYSKESEFPIIRNYHTQMKPNVYRKDPILCMDDHCY